MIPNNICLKEVNKRIKENKIKDCIIVGNDPEELQIIDTFKLKKHHKPTNKEIRLATEVVKQMYPIYKRSNKETIANFVKDIFSMEVPIERITKVKSFKEILFKKIIVGVESIPNTNKNKTIVKKVRKK